MRIEADDLAGLFREAALGLAEVMAPLLTGDEPTSEAGGEPPHAVGPEAHTSHQEVRLQAPDRDALMVDWLNELIFLAERDHCVYDEIEVRQVFEQALSARVGGRPIGGFGLHVKAATFHGLHIRSQDGRYLAHLVLDV